MTDNFPKGPPVLAAEIDRDRKLDAPLRDVAGVADDDRPGPLKRAARAIRLGFWLPTVIALVILGSLWQYYATDVNHFVIPTFGAMWQNITSQPGPYWRGFLITVREVAIGSGTGMVLGFLVAVIASEFDFVARATIPYVVMMMVTPIVAIAPALVVALGIGAMPKYIVASIVVFPAILINTLAGLRNVDPRALDFMVTVNASRWEKFRYLRFHSSLPFLFVGLRIALPVSIVGATVAEISAPGTAGGLASLISLSSANGNITTAWAAIFLLCLMGLVLVTGWWIVRKRVLWWDNETRTSAAR